MDKKKLAGIIIGPIFGVIFILLLSYFIYQRTRDGAYSVVTGDATNDEDVKLDDLATSD